MPLEKNNLRYHLNKINSNPIENIENHITIRNMKKSLSKQYLSKIADTNTHNNNSKKIDLLSKI